MDIGDHGTLNDQINLIERESRYNGDESVKIKSVNRYYNNEKGDVVSKLNTINLKSKKNQSIIQDSSDSQ